MRAALKEFIQQELNQGKNLGDIGENDSLLEYGVLDSFALLNLLTFIEEQTGVRVPDAEVVVENFDSISAIERTVNRLRAAGR